MKNIFGNLGIILSYLGAVFYILIPIFTWIFMSQIQIYHIWLMFPMIGIILSILGIFKDDNKILGIIGLIIGIFIFIIGISLFFSTSYLELIGLLPRA